MNVDEILEHHGIKGMKWGVRNRRVSTSSSTSSKPQSERDTTSKESKARARSWSKQYTNRDKMSNEELKKSVDRLRLENEFGRLSSEASASTKSSGKKIAAKYAGQALSVAIPIVVSAAVKSSLNAANKKK